ncbi:MAG: hypothetical protein LUG99_09740 [Lachnospiraceae bacterium]|nr:hypothetical protein [Lachnospiraceae bacterium]
MNEQKIVRCNNCGKKISCEDELLLEGALFVEQDWGYFSRKDGERHSFCLCEDCYDKIVRNFALPVEVEEYLC